MTTVALLAVALLFGGMTLYSFGFAAFLFSALPPDVAGPTLRRAFPLFYLFVLAAASVAAISLWSIDPRSSLLMALLVVTTLPARQWLMPAINRATDTGATSRFKSLHGLSVAVTLAHIAMTAYVLSRFV